VIQSLSRLDHWFAFREKRQKSSGNLRGTMTAGSRGAKPLETKPDPQLICFSAIGTVRTDARDLPRHWSLSDVEGTLDILPQFAEGLSDVLPGQRIVVLFHFHRSPPFSPDMLRQTPPHRQGPLGVFSICSPKRPNAIGLSVLDVLKKKGSRVRVRGLDMIDGTPILDIKPHIENRHHCPSYDGER